MFTLVLLFHTYFGFVEQTNPKEGGPKEEHDFLSESYVQVLFPGGLTTAKFDVHLVHDVILEHNETFRISIDPLSLPHGVVLGAVSNATVTIWMMIVSSNLIAVRVHVCAMDYC